MFKKIVMAFRGKSIKPEPQVPSGNIFLSQEEIITLLQLIRSSNFSGEMIEKVYNVTFKLQDSYNKFNNK